ncbi:MAG: RloB family protein [Bacteroidales bacterium]|nr:RloB family protein [Bacteroidales bacterium]
MTYRKEIKKRKVSKQRILIVCEGKTERLYLDGLKKTLPRQVQRDIEVNVVTAKEGEPLKAISEIAKKVGIARGEKQSYSEQWLVFDDDNRDLAEVFRQLLGSNIRFAYSSIALEFWFLLHYRNTSRQYPLADDVINDLIQYLGTYSKTDSAIWGRLNPNYQIAKERAKAIRTQHQRDGVPLPNCKPYSNMDELVDRIKELN